MSIALQEPETIHEITSQIDKSYFTNDPKRKQNKALFMILDYISRQKDVEELEFDTMTILSVCSKIDNLNRVINNIFENKEEFASYIETLRESPVDSSNLSFHVKELKKINITNELYHTLQDYQEELLDNYQKWDKENIIDNLESKVLEVSNKYNADESRTFIEANKDRIDKYKDKKPIENGFVGLPTPFDRVNKFTRGLLRPGSVTVINAKTGTGKSIFLKNVAKFLAIDNGIPVYLGANEQKINEQEERIIKEITGLPMIIIENNLYNANRKYIKVDGDKYNTKECKEKVLSAVKKIDESPLYLDQIRAYTPQTLVQRAKYFKRRYNIQTFIWDYVKETSASVAQDIALRHWLSGIVETMKEEIADRLNLPVLTASQAKTYEELMAAESFGIHKFSTNFSVLRKLDDKEKRPFDGNYGLTVKKNRYGRAHKDPENQWISMEMDEDYLKFQEIKQ